jgi:undecaprenyl pyrophosphate phosphatase UppP
METKQLITIVITVVVTETVRRLASFVADKLKTATEAEKARTAINILLNRYLILVLVQFIILCLFGFILRNQVHSEAKVTHDTVFLMILNFTFILRVGDNLFKAIGDYKDYSKALFKKKNSANHVNTPA